MSKILYLSSSAVKNADLPQVRNSHSNNDVRGVRILLSKSMLWTWNSGLGLSKTIHMPQIIKNVML